MKLEAGKTYVFKDDAARDEYIDEGRFKFILDQHYNDGFKLDSVMFGIGQVGGFGVNVIGVKQYHLFKEKEYKPFDISEYEFSGDLILSGDTDSSIILDTQCESFISINKQDVEAMAKHFKLI